MQSTFPGIDPFIESSGLRVRTFGLLLMGFSALTAFASVGWSIRTTVTHDVGGYPLMVVVDGKLFFTSYLIDGVKPVRVSAPHIFFGADRLGLDERQQFIFGAKPGEGRADWRFEIREQRSKALRAAGVPQGSQKQIEGPQVGSLVPDRKVAILSLILPNQEIRYLGLRPVKHIINEETKTLHEPILVKDRADAVEVRERYLYEGVIKK